MTDMLLIGDAHAHPDFDNKRFDYLANYISRHQPSIILSIGDWADMASLSSYDKGRKSFEGRRYVRDVASCIDAQRRLFAGVDAVNEGKSKGHRARYRPRTIMVMGNHDDARIARVVEESPELEGVVSIDDLQYNDYWEEVVPFKSVINVEGFACSHYFPSGVMGRSIGGENVATNLLKKNFMSSIQGHSHLWDEATRTNAVGQKMLGLVIGCYVHPKMISDWNANTSQMYWNGIVHLRGVSNGWAEDVQRISQEALARDYRR